MELLRHKIETGLITTSKSDGDSDGKNAAPKKLTIKDVQEKAKVFLLNAKVFEKALKLFNGKNSFHIIRY